MNKKITFLDMLFEEITLYKYRKHNFSGDNDLSIIVLWKDNKWKYFRQTGFANSGGSE